MSSWLARIRDAFKRIYAFCIPLRFSLVALATLLFAFCFSDQGWDIQRALVEDNVPSAPAKIFLFLFASFLLALEIWYWSRQMLRFRPAARQQDDPCRNPITEPLVEDANDPGDRLARLIVDYLPRFLGALVFVIEIIGMVIVKNQYKGGSPLHFWSTIAWLAVLLVVYLVFVVKRRDWFNLTHHSRLTTIRSWKQFAGTTRTILYVSLGVELLLFAWALINPVSWWVIGVCAALVLTVGVWVPLGSAVVAIGEWLQIPILLLLLIWAVLWSPLTEHNHAIRTLPQSASRLTLDAAYDAWYTRAAALPRVNGKVPAIIVATEGGGIRAAYWTATVLTSLQDQIPSFRQRLFAISGVSGGSYGSTVFDALLAHRDAAHGHDLLKPQVHELLQFDALSGTLASMAQPDLFQRFWPIPMFPDRASALEKGWESGWRDRFNDDFFSRGLVELFATHQDLPLLFLNGTTVELGDRIITAPVDFRNAIEFRDAHDAMAKFGAKDLRLSTAALMSARFTYVSPAGRVPNGNAADDEIFGHVVDGGYFENSGGVTASEVATYLRRRHGDVQPYIIFIDMIEPRCTNGLQTAYCPAAGVSGPGAPLSVTKFAGEVMSPLYALLNARGARGYQAVGDTVTATIFGKANVIEFRLTTTTVPLPLGWVLSRQAMNEMDDAMPCDVRNRAGVSLVGSVIGEAPRPMQCHQQTVPMPPPQPTACQNGKCS